MVRHLRLFLLLVGIVPVLPAPARSAPWESVGPDAGSVQAMIQSPDDPDRFYCLPFRRGVSRSDDHAATWQRVDTGLGDEASFQTLATSSTDADLVLIVPRVGSDVRRSTDAGSTWESCTVGGGWHFPEALRFDPVDGNLALLAVRSGADPGVFRTTDGGLTWAPSNVGLPSVTPRALEFHPTISGEALVGVSEGLFRTTDGGLSWAAVDTGGSTSVSSISYCRGTPSRVYARGWPDLLRSDDGGLTFTPITDPCTNPMNCGTLLLAAHPTVPDRVLSAPHDIYCTGDCMYLPRLSLSTDGGTTWTGVYQSGASWGEVEPMADLFFDLDVPGHAHGTAGALDGIVRSTDDGQSWARRMSGISAVEVLGLGRDAAGRLYVQTSLRGGLFTTTSLDSAWTPTSPSSGLSESILAAAVPVGGSGVVVQGGGSASFDTFSPFFTRSTDAGGTWDVFPLEQHSLFVFAGPLVASPGNGDVVYYWADLVGIGEVWRIEGTYPWTSYDPGFLAEAGVIDPADPHRTFAVETGSSGRVHLSTDGAATWTERSAGLPADTAVDLFLDPADADRLLVIYRNAGAYRTTDAGLTWTTVDGGVGGAVVAAEWDPVTGEIFRAVNGMGVHVTGQGFLGDGLDAVNLRALEFLPGSRTLLLGTRYAGVYARTIDPPPTGAPNLLEAPGALRVRTAPNPFAAETRVEFFLPAASDVDVGVYAVDGRRVATLAAGPAAAGWNRVGWSGRTDRGTAAGGVYFVRVRAGGRETTRRIVRVAAD